ncbi:hypothetical protein SAMN04487851_11462 [Prevotella sp. tc2-28]|uniref:hypothetical protein n=1 Tax=Prevotella sp. tc2-28 TaxID=1761888 RepID=UPI000898A07C|nr:hypothetical protein [Prevotella sp. tc2-28]SEA79747.1 hypothetical protein SAMN04487851_11462 [Prevotella sp. tc2-28]
MKINSFGSMPQSEIAPVAVVEEVRNENQFFDFEKAKVQELSLDQLKRTVKENRGDDRTCPHGIYHFALVQQILDMCAEHGYNAEVYDLFATNNRDKQTPGVSLNPEIEAKYGERAVEAHTLRRIYANIRLKDFDTDEVTTNLAVAYTQKGIQLGFGRNVMVCHNQCMLGSGRFISDYQCRKDTAKATLQGMLQTVGSWLTNAQNITIEDDATIERMKSSILTAEQIYTILGMLMSIRVAHDTSVKSIRYNGEVYPLNQAQLSQFTENLLVKQKEEGRITAWSFYNAATDLYKPQSAETNMIMPQNLSMIEFMRAQEIF